MTSRSPWALSAAEFPAREKDRGGLPHILLLERRLGGVIRYLAWLSVIDGELNELAIMSGARAVYLSPSLSLPLASVG